MEEPFVEYRVMNGAQKMAPKVVGLSPENPQMILVLVQPGKGFEVPNTPETIAKLQSMNCDCSALRGLNSTESSNIPDGLDAGGDSSGGSGQDVPWDQIIKFTADLLAKVNWSNLFSGEKKRTEEQLEKFRSENAFQLYPRIQEGGPWRPVGYGNLDKMTLDELRYFIEWRMPMYKKQMSKKNWGDTEQRVIDRYNRIADLMKETAIETFKAKAGCYTHSGIYDDLVSASNGSSTINPHSTTIRTFQENCPANPGDGTGVYTGGSSSGGSGGTGNPGKNSPQTAGFGNTLGFLALLGLAGGAYYQSKKNKQKTKAPKGPNKPAQEVVL